MRGSFSWSVLVVQADIFNLPNFIIASNPEALKQAMFENNSRLGAEVKYEFISQITVGKNQGKFIAWFYEKVNIDPVIKKRNR
jgi:hypothetical protein